MSDEKKSPGALFIPAGIMIGLGIGFLYNNLVSWMFIGIGVGFLCFALYSIFSKK